MPLDLTAYARVRPFLYHLTDRVNLGRIRRTGELISVSELKKQTGKPAPAAERRTAHSTIVVGGEEVRIRDQTPLYFGNVKLDEGWTPKRFVAHLDRHVFFWPGTPRAPIDYGLRHFGRYEDEGPVVLRVRFLEVLEANPKSPPHFCRYNSGSPRMHGGRPSPRGASTFQRADAVSYRPSAVVEVVFRDRVRLPDRLERSAAPNGPWTPIRIDREASDG